MATLELPSPRRLAAPKLRSAEYLLLANAAGLILVSVILRTWKLGNIPGLNGDEAWSGIQAMKLLRGEAIAWHTPTGNPLNPFFLGPQILLHAIFSPSFALLRTVSLVSGLAALGVNYWLCRKAFDRSTAAISTVALAVLPVNVAYSRFAWDASQSLLATLPVVYLPLIGLADPERRSRWFVAGAIVYGLAIIVHPTNIMAAPWLLIPLIASRENLCAPVLAAVRSRLSRLRILVAALAIIGCAVGARHWLVDNSRAQPHSSQPYGEITSFAGRLVQLFSGTTVYRFIPGLGPSDVGPADGSSAGPQISAVTIDLMGWAVAMLASYGFYRSLRSGPSRADAAVTLACFMTVLGHFILAGPQALAPGLERYSIVLVAPCVLVVARGIAWWLGTSGSRRQVATALFCLYAWTTLATFYFNYFRTLEHNGGTAHLAFRTAAMEPKEQVIEYVAQHRTRDQPTVVYTDDWWLRRPLEYLAYRHPGIQVRARSDELTPERSGGSDINAQTWFVEFAGSPRARALRDRLQGLGIDPTPEMVIASYGEKELIAIFHPSEKFLKK